ncbi:MAG: acyl-CoA reductase [Saprospiraceae bacterium]|nr:acyl-CoA reductase [Saprospiraceae bacterium]
MGNVMLDWLDLFQQLGIEVLKDIPSRQEAFDKARLENPWFESREIERMIGTIASQYLQKNELEKWLSQYPVSPQPKKVGLIAAANIPLVGFHDLLCILISGHQAIVKCSERDKQLYVWLQDILIRLEPKAAEMFILVDKLSDYDMIIATGSDQSATLFKEYFSKVPHLIRSHRNSVAWLHGDESDEEILLLGEDVFSYFGLGCRNVSKIYIPQDIDIDKILGLWDKHYSYLKNNTRYQNNYEYRLAICLLNPIQFFQSETLLLIQNNEINSPLATLHFENYTSEEDLREKIVTHKNRIQSVVGPKDLRNIENVRFGNSQKPGLSEYADGIDTMEFLNMKQ